MRLAATKGTVLRIVADGPDADAAAYAFVELVADGFGNLETGADG